MDQLKSALRYLKRIHFWIICPLVVLLGLGAWYVAVGSLNEEKDANVGSIEGDFSAVRQVSSTAPHPNTDVAAEMDKLITKTRSEIREAWENKAAQQAEVLKWPDFPWPDAMTSSFLRIVEPLRPIERMVKVSDEEALNVIQRETYRNYVLQELPHLAELAGAVWVATSGDTSRIDELDAAQANAIVDWKKESQQRILEKHFEWDSGAPSTLEILYAQEDLWVLGHLMQIISRTNEGATTRHSAAVREITELKIGRDAVYSDATVATVGEDGQVTHRNSGVAQVAPTPAGEGQIPDPAEGRYVDENYEPLPAATLRQVMEKDGELAPEQAYLAVAKRIPVRMRVSIDQRNVNRFLVECANSELTVEVRQLMINPNYSPGGARTGRGGGGGFGEGPSYAGAARNEGRKDEQVGNQFPYDLDVEIYGIVSIYNPVDQEALGIEPGDEAAGEENMVQARVRTVRR